MENNGKTYLRIITRLINFIQDVAQKHLEEIALGNRNIWDELRHVSERQERDNEQQNDLIDAIAALHLRITEQDAEIARILTYQQMLVGILMDKQNDDITSGD